ncbi:MAG: pyridoxal phosphate-dependent aminotransferase [Myxococcales bacterium]|nr:pyridoxal phosphate-dependent aminotransferase [Myxococcales bacterium]
MFSRRSDFGREKNRLTLAHHKRLRAGDAICDLTLSNPTTEGLLELPGHSAALKALADARGRHYRPHALGLPEAREALAERLADWGPRPEAHRLVLTASTSEAYAFAMQLFCDAGDGLLIPRPSYPLLDGLCQLEAVRPQPYALAYDGRWHLQPSALRAALDASSRAAVAIHPNNPSGSLFDAEGAAALAALELPVISDEVFAPYPLEAARCSALRELLPASSLCLTLHGLSKLGALPQLKLSSIVLSGPDAQVEEALERLESIADNFLSVSTPVQLALPAILEQLPQTVSTIGERVRGNLRRLKSRCEGSAVSVLHAEAGWSAVLRLPALLDDEGWALDLLEHAATLVQPGYFYDLQGGPYLVVSLLPRSRDFEGGIDRLLERVNHHCRPEAKGSGPSGRQPGIR